MRLVMLDRDGTINVERNYLSAPEQVELLPRAAAGIRLLRQLGLPTVVVTNQSGLARGYFDLVALQNIHARLSEQLAEQGATLDAIYYCPHLPEEQCECRKPAPALAQQAASEFDAELHQSFLIGDNVCDIELGRRVGATTILVKTGYGTRVLAAASAQPDYVADDLFAAAQVIQTLMGAAGENKK
jgi:D-glycero-D-manno-heptose 1,7-bisphosphate phosphatase